MPGVRIQKDLLSGRLKKVVFEGLPLAFMPLTIEALHCSSVQKLSPSSWARSFGPHRGLANKTMLSAKLRARCRDGPTCGNRLLHVVLVVFVTQCETRSRVMVLSFLASITFACGVIGVYGMSDHPSFSGSEHHPRPWDFECWNQESWSSCVSLMGGSWVIDLTRCVHFSP